VKAIGPKLVIATHNAGKLREIRELLEPFGIECVGAAELDLAEKHAISHRAEAFKKLVAALDR
jgi:XTP/dITP diphosphohydrolase